MELVRTAKTAVSIAAALELLTYTYSSADPIEVLARVDLGSDDRPVAGGGVYIVDFYINDVVVVPRSQLQVDSGVTRTIAVSKQIALVQGDVVSIRATGLGADTAVDTVASLRDVTPVRKSELFGLGTVLVDDSYGGTNDDPYPLSCVYPADGPGIAGVEIRFYLKADYDAGRRQNGFVVARSETGPDGRWLRPVMLDPGSYTLVALKPGAYGPDAKDVVVSAE